MGVISDVAAKLQALWAKSPEAQKAVLTVGVTHPDYPATHVSAFGLGMSGLSTGTNDLLQYLQIDGGLLERYSDYHSMNEYPELASALDIFADDACQPNTQTGKTVWATSENERVQEVLNDLFERTLLIDEQVWPMARTLAMYGQDFEELLVTERGVEGLQFLPPETMRRVEDARGALVGYVQEFRGQVVYSPKDWETAIREREARLKDPKGSANKQTLPILAFHPWEIAHMRLLGSSRHSSYGVSLLEAARWIFRRVVLLEDCALIYRLQRAPERMAFYVDVGDKPAQEALAMVQRVRQQYKKRRFINPRTGKLDLKLDPMSPDDDIWLPSRNGQDGTRVEVLQGPQWQSMDDIVYFLDKMFAAIKIPKAYLAREEGVVRATLSSQDVRFARTILRLQREVINGLRKVTRTHLQALNVDVSKVKYNIEMTVPSAIIELAQIEVRTARADLAARMQDFVSRRWILSDVFKLSDGEIEAMFRERGDDVQRDAEAQAQAQELLAPSEEGRERPPIPVSRQPARRTSAPQSATGLVFDRMKTDPVVMESLHYLRKSHVSIEKKLEGLERLLALLTHTGARRSA